MHAEDRTDPNGSPTPTCPPDPASERDDDDHHLLTNASAFCWYPVPNDPTPEESGDRKAKENHTHGCSSTLSSSWACLVCSAPTTIETQVEAMISSGSAKSRGVTEMQEERWGRPWNRFHSSAVPRFRLGRSGRVRAARHVLGTPASTLRKLETCERQLLHSCGAKISVEPARAAKSPLTQGTLKI
jgi:hypothetical protein